jgi:ABC-type uncharacterized transport system substrate-binding protein
MLFLCAIAGCSRRRPAAAPFPVPLPGATSDNTVRTAEIPAAREIAILFNSTGGHAEVAEQLRRQLPGPTYRVTLADVEAAESKPLLDALRGKPGLTIVAVGLPASRIARDHFSGPVVFSQVYNYQELMVPGRSVRGVAAMPPLDLQLQEWKKLDPKLSRVGLILSQSHESLLASAKDAAKAASVTIKHEFSDSDRATLYLFKRLAPQIDGLLLFPDDRILSPRVLRELLAYAASHGVRVSVSSDTLLQWGAFISATPTPSDVARTLRRTLDGMAGAPADLESVIVPLSEFSLTINSQIASRLRMALPLAASSWVVRRQ